jgi:hypothetical protein
MSGGRNLRVRASSALTWVLMIGCSAVPRVQAPPPMAIVSDPARVQAPPPSAGAGPALCDDSIFVAEVDPASTLDFHPTECRLELAGWYAARVGLDGPPRASVFLFCSEREGSEESITLRYNGPPIEGSLTELFDPFHTDGRDNANLMSYAYDGPNGMARYRFLGGEVRFHRPIRPWMEATSEAREGRSSYVEVGLDLRFEGDRRWRAAMRICPDYGAWGPAGTHD